MTAPKSPQQKVREPLSAVFDSPLIRKLRYETYGKDIGQHSWVMADEFRSDKDRDRTGQCLGREKTTSLA